MLAAASIGASVVTIVMLLRLYLGWSFVGNRLMSARIEYEETGWYDGQTWVKPRPVLARDRLLSSNTVLPVMRRIRTALLAASAASCMSVLALQLCSAGSQQAAAPEVTLRRQAELAQQCVLAVNLVGMHECSKVWHCQLLACALSCRYPQPRSSGALLLVW